DGSCDLYWVGVGGNRKLASAVKRTVELANSQELTARERKHVKAVELFSNG
ncbi:hypothetical protein M9458_035956, partial [Cirrhinus mrigala]